MTDTTDRAPNTGTPDVDNRYDDDDYFENDDDEGERRNSMITLHRGIARAIARGLRAYERELTPDNAGRLDSGNGIVEGVFSGLSRFYEELGATSRDVRDDLRENRRRRRARRDRDDDRAPAPVEIDYERLAKLVADEIRKSPGKPAGK